MKEEIKFNILNLDSDILNRNDSFIVAHIFKIVFTTDYNCKISKSKYLLSYLYLIYNIIKIFV